MNIRTSRIIQAIGAVAVLIGADILLAGCPAGTQQPSPAQIAAGTAAFNNGLACAMAVQNAVAGAPAGSTDAQKAEIAVTAAALSPPCQALPAAATAALTAPKLPVQ